jgi:hypothetical protein
MIQTATAHKWITPGQEGCPKGGVVVQLRETEFFDQEPPLRPLALLASTPPGQGNRLRRFQGDALLHGLVTFSRCLNLRNGLDKLAATSWLRRRR